jgi:hypothetical protein
VAGERGLSYMYMITQIPGSRQPLWYAGALTFPSEEPSTYAGFDRIFSRDEVFEARFAGLRRFVDERLAAGDEWVTVFGCHPVQVMARDWLERAPRRSWAGSTRSRAARRSLEPRPTSGACASTSRTILT